MNPGRGPNFSISPNNERGALHFPSKVAQGARTRATSQTGTEITHLSKWFDHIGRECSGHPHHAIFAALVPPEARFCRNETFLSPLSELRIRDIDIAFGRATKQSIFTWLCCARRSQKKLYPYIVFRMYGGLQLFSTNVQKLSKSIALEIME